MRKLFVISILATGLAAAPALAGDCGSGYGAEKASNKMKADIVDTAVKAGSFNTLVTAVKAAGLVDVLKSDGPFTVFAPTDEAFAQIPERQLNALLADKQALKQVLTYHVVPGKVMSSDVVKLSSAETVQGQSVRIDASSGVKVDGANVIKTDIETSNGVIHVIDKVILPNT
jgi:uncharacterized surface protein with fasciclin (FAS1) repeats